jgi:hypothetical protein
VQAVATAFKEGAFGGFGTGTRGDLAATLAAVLLDPEARSPIMAHDASTGGVREPVVKSLHLLRALEYAPSLGYEEISVNYEFGQMPYHADSVFNFFQYDFQPSGPVETAGLVAPEALLLATPQVISFMNAANDLILTKSATKTRWDIVRRNKGTLAYSPTNGLTCAVDVVNELDDLLTGGRLSSHRRSVIEAAFNQTLRDCTLCGYVSRGVPDGATLTSLHAAKCNWYTGCGAGQPLDAPLARWSFQINLTLAISSGIRARPNLMIEGSNGKRFPIHSVAHFAWKGAGTFLYPVASNADYNPDLLRQ